MRGAKSGITFSTSRYQGMFPIYGCKGGGGLAKKGCKITRLNLVDGSKKIILTLDSCRCNSVGQIFEQEADI